MADLILAGVHHVLMLALAMLIATEAAQLRPGVAGPSLARLGRLDASYGAVAGAIVVAGFLRVILGAKDSSYYLGNPVFWTKIALFVAVGALSILPTLRLRVWGRQAAARPDFAPPADELRRVRALVLAQGFVFMLIPLAAAAMARGYGL